MRYAILVDGVIENIIWLSDANASDFSGAVKLGDRPVEIGDVYLDGKFYHNGVEQLTSEEALFSAQQENGQLTSYLDTLAERVLDDNATHQTELADYAEYAADLEYQIALTELGMEVQ